MVYCTLKKKSSDSAVYYIGCSLEDINGEVEFFAKSINPRILQQPKENNVSSSMLTKLAVKYKDKFLKGEFPDKISYER